MSEWEYDELTPLERSLKAEVESLKKKLAAAEWDLAHYRDCYMLSVGMTAEQLAARSAVLEMERKREANV